MKNNAFTTLLLLTVLLLSACSAGVSPAGVSPAGVSPTGVSPTGVSPTGVMPTAGADVSTPTPMVTPAIADIYEKGGDPKPAPAPTPTPTPTPAPTVAPESYGRGNSTGNIVNHGEVAFDGENLIVFETLNARFANLYKGCVYYVNANENGKVYRQKLTGEPAECICDATDVAYVNIVDDTIFYRSTDDKYSVRRMDLDGTNDVRLTEMRASRLAAVDGWLYYANWDEGTEGLWRMDYDGGRQTLLYGDDVPLFINVANGIVYWVSYENDDCLAVTDPETGETLFVREIKNVASLNVAGDTMFFYMEGEAGTGLYAANADITGVRLLYEAKGIYNINTANDKVYFRAADDLLYCCDKDGSNVEKVAG